MTRRELLAGLGAIGLAVGAVLAARVAFAPFEQRVAWFSVASLCAIGWSGLLAWLRVPASRIGLLIVVVAAVAIVTLTVTPWLPASAAPRRRSSPAAAKPHG